MELRELADLFDVSTEEFLKTIASEIYELDVDFPPEELPDEVLEFRKQTDQESIDNPSMEDFSSNGRSVAAKSEPTDTFVKKLMKQGKVGLGLLVILTNGSDRRVEQIRSELRHLGEEAVQDSIDLVTSVIREYIEQFRNQDVVAQYLSVLPGISSIYISVANRWLDERSFWDWQPENVGKQPKISTEAKKL